MPRSNLNKTEKELYSMWDYFRKVCIRKTSVQYEGVPYDETWLTFDGFVKENWFRYLRAKVKWKNYKRVAPRKRNGIPEPLKLNNIRLKRKALELGFTKENTVFTSPSDSMKYFEFTHTYMFEGQMLGTRDIKNILKKRGIQLSMEQITKRLNNGWNLFAANEHSKIKWKGKYRSYEEIAKMEKVGVAMLKKRNSEINDIRKSLDYCRQWGGFPTYDFEGQKLRKMEICEILSKRTGIDDGTMNGRFVKFGMNLSLLTLPLGVKPTLRKKIFALKDGVETEYESIDLASRALNIPAGNVSQAASGKYIHAGGYKFRFDGGQYNNSEIRTMDEQMAEAREKMVQNSQARHSQQIRHCQSCNKDKPKDEFNEKNFVRCKECMAREKGVVRIGLFKEREEKFQQGLLWCSDHKDYLTLDKFYKSIHGARGYMSVCKDCMYERIKLKKYGSKEIKEASEALVLLKEKIRDRVSDRAKT